MRPVLLFLLLAAAAGCSADPLEKVEPQCPQSCYSGPRDTDGVGACRPGTPVCDDVGRIVECRDEVTPQPEICNIVDDDCDGDADNLVRTPLNDENTCKQCGLCRRTDQYCVQGVWLCDYRQPVPDTETSCDGVDEDCDCRTDESEDLYPSTPFCYDGPDGTSVYGQCRAGLVECSGGAERCVGQVLPSAETCNAIDDDCNDLVDDAVTNYDGVDVVLAIDVSGSMTQYSEAVRDAICSYTGSSVYRFAVIRIAQPDGGVTLSLNLTSDVSAVCEEMHMVAQTSGGGSEPTIDAALAVVSVENTLGLDWDAGNKRLFVGFADEEAQSVFCFGDTDCLSAYAYEVEESCVETNTTVYWFSDNYIYEDMAIPCGGFVFPLSDRPGAMERDLESIVMDVCLTN